MISCSLAGNSQWFQVLFNAGAIPLPILAANLALHAGSPRISDPSGFLSLVAASIAYFFVNTLVVASMVSFGGGTSLLANWRRSYLWTFPQYLAGGAIVAGLQLLEAIIGLAAFLVATPAVILVYVSYRVYLGRVQELENGMRQQAVHHAEALRQVLSASSDPRTTALLERHLREIELEASGEGCLSAELLPA